MAYQQQIEFLEDEVKRIQDKINMHLGEIDDLEMELKDAMIDLADWRSKEQNSQEDSHGK
jgi:hypothetical protein